MQYLSRENKFFHLIFLSAIFLLGVIMFRIYSNILGEVERFSFEDRRVKSSVFQKLLPLDQSFVTDNMRSSDVKQCFIGYAITQQEIDEINLAFEEFFPKPKVIVRTSAQRVAAASVAKKRCHEKNSKPSMSKTKGKHMDEDCCPDPDEWPDPECAYSASDYAIMLSGPKKKK